MGYPRTIWGKASASGRDSMVLGFEQAVTAVNNDDGGRWWPHRRCRATWVAGRSGALGSSAPLQKNSMSTVIPVFASPSGQSCGGISSWSRPIR